MESEMEIKRSGSQPSGTGSADYFTGTVRVDPLFNPPEPARASGSSVTFEPGARTAWQGRYQALFEEGLIPQELYDDLKRGISGTRAEPRPRFEIGLDTHRLIERLDILSGLDERQLERVAKLLRPRFTVPNERILRRGDRRGTPFSLLRPAPSR
jgi:hypothetical protein